MNALDNMASCLRLFAKTNNKKWEVEATEWGRISQELKKKIEAHNYTEDDKKYAIVQELDRKWTLLSKGKL